TSDKIIGKGKRTFKGILNGRDLTISDVYVVEGFHVNIVSSTRVRNSGLWMCEEDYTVRYGSADKNVIVCKLQLVNNLIFLEYKQLDIYLKAPSMLLYNVIPISQAGIVMSIPGKRRTLPWRSSRDQPNPREDTATMWHLRLGHLSKDALEKAVLHARNIKIKGIPRIECEICARTHATQVISRRKSERSAPRPFWRIHWDLQDYTEGYDGSRWLLVIKDEYSGWMFARALRMKQHDIVFNALFYFERWVQRQFGVVICVIRQDNKRAVIAVKGLTQFQHWANFQGIELELVPPDTHEANGAAEQSGKQITTKSISMLHGANLPGEL
ncbi:hypothetical protein H9Q70_014594, partial [Fusarium xylarioides]